jgi:hypothetical protein
VRSSNPAHAVATPMLPTAVGSKVSYQPGEVWMPARTEQSAGREPGSGKPVAIGGYSGTAGMTAAPASTTGTTPLSHGTASLSEGSGVCSPVLPGPSHAAVARAKSQTIVRRSAVQCGSQRAARRASSRQLERTLLRTKLRIGLLCRWRLGGQRKSWSITTVYRPLPLHSADGHSLDEVPLKTEEHN